VSFPGDEACKSAGGVTVQVHAMYMSSGCALTCNIRVLPRSSRYLYAWTMKKQKNQKYFLKLSYTWVLYFDSIQFLILHASLARFVPISWASFVEFFTSLSGVSFILGFWCLGSDWLAVFILVRTGALYIFSWETYLLHIKLLVYTFNRQWMHTRM